MSSNQGVLFLGKVNGESEWLKNDDEDTDGKYLGEIRNGVPEGQGTLTSSNGEKYEGEWKEGEKHGQGTLTFPDGQKYVGEFHEGQPHGQGTETLPDGEQYEGEWKEGKEWNGKLYDTDGKIIGTYVNGVKQ